MTSQFIRKNSVQLPPRKCFHYAYACRQLYELSNDTVKPVLSGLAFSSHPYYAVSCMCRIFYHYQVYRREVNDPVARHLPTRVSDHLESLLLFYW